MARKQTQKQRAATAKRILEGAIGLWAEKGYEAATMRELGRRLKMSPSALYTYFPSKEAIVIHLYEQINRQVGDAFKQQDDGETDLGKNLVRYLKLKLNALRPHRNALPTLFREAVDPNSMLSPFSSKSHPTMTRTLALFEDWVGRSADRDDALEIARSIWFVHIALILFWLHDRSERQNITLELVEQSGGISKLLPMLTMIPGASDHLRLLSSLFQSAQVEPSLEVEPHSDPVDRAVDVVVIGAGPNGCLYASFLKQMQPNASILVLNKASSASYKIGESTLSGFCKALRTVGIPHETMQSLFYKKNGLGFFHIDGGTTRVEDAHEYILEAFDETFQVERSVLDSLVIRNTQRLGVTLLHGATASVDCDQLGPQGGVVSYRIGSSQRRVRAKLVVDASGPAGYIARQLGLWTSDDLPFQTSAIWGYWPGIPPLGTRTGFTRRTQFPRDEYTQHVCFPEGWMWLIPLWTWQTAPEGNLSQMLNHVERGGRIEGRERLSEDFGCPQSFLSSVGLVLRSDRDETMRKDPRQAWQHYRHKYPAIADLLGSGDPMDEPYGRSRPFDQRLNMRGYARRVTGPGWLSIGDAAFFVDPLISPGLTAGAATAYRAAHATAQMFETGDRNEPMREYESYVHDLHSALERDNQLVYMSFNHPETMTLIQRLQEVDARRHFLVGRNRDYAREDTNVWGVLSPDYQHFQAQAWEILRTAEQNAGRAVPVSEQSASDYAGAAVELRHVLSQYLSQNKQLTPYVLD